MISQFLERKLGANWRTLLFGGFASSCGFVVANPELIAAVLTPLAAKRVFSVAALVSGFIAFKNAKDKQVTGGQVRQDAGTFPRIAGESEDKIPGL